MRSLRVRIPKAKRILDFGCGTGWFLAEAHVDGDPLRVGVDYSFQSLRGLNGIPKLQPDQVNPLHLASADGVHLPFADGSFEAVVGHVSMPYMNTRAALCEIHRVLAPGGSLLLTFHSYRYLRQKLWGSLMSGRWKDVVYMCYIGTNGLLNHFDLPQTQVWWKPSAIETVNTHRGVYMAARRAGFIQISSEGRPNKIFFHVTAQKPNEGGPVLPAPEAIYPEPQAPRLSKTARDLGVFVLRKM
jgi:SAM-dependent methyltransferase